MKIDNTALAKYKILGLRTFGLVLIVIAASYFIHIALTDIDASMIQRKLRSGWQKELSNKQTVQHKTEATETKSSDTTEATDTNKVNRSNSEAPPARTNVTKGKPFARLVIPRINLDTIVLEGTSADILKRGPGHLEETAHPGENGNMVISGHRVTYGRPFYSLDALKKGDPIDVYSISSQKFTYYVVDSKVVKPTDVSVIKPTSDKTLTLTTCNPRYSARTRLIVIAKMQP